MSETIETAPKDRAIWAWEEARGYEAKMVWNGHEWECVSFNGSPLGIGFYPTHWAPARVFQANLLSDGEGRK